MILVLKIIGFESGTTNSVNPEKNTCHWQSICYETPLIFKISVREIFFKSDSLRVTNKCDQIGLIKIFEEFGTL